MPLESFPILSIIKSNGSFSFDPERLGLSTCHAIAWLIKEKKVINNNNTLTLA